MVVTDLLVADCLSCPLCPDLAESDPGKYNVKSGLLARQPSLRRPFCPLTPTGLPLSVLSAVAAVDDVASDLNAEVATDGPGL